MNHIDLGKLGAIGARGIVLHAGDRHGGTYFFYADNREGQTWRKFEVDPKTLPDKFGVNLEVVDLLIANSVSTAVLKARANAPPKVVFLNLDALHDLADPSQGQGGRARQGHLSEKGHGLPFETFLIHEKGVFYAIPEAALNPLEEEDAGEAKVLVRRGVVAAAVPNNDIPIGTNCVVVNLTEIFPSGAAG
jgi:hypothetical protein